MRRRKESLMKIRRFVAIGIVSALIPLAASSCSGGSGGGSGGAGGTGGGSSSSQSGAGGSSGVMHWYTTCGDPVCGMGGGGGGSGVASCTTEQEGDPCSADGAQCDPGK